MRKPRRTERHTKPTSGGVSLGTPNGGVDDQAATVPSPARTLPDKEQPRTAKAGAPPTIAVSPSPKAMPNASTPAVRSAEQHAPSPTTTTPSLSPSALSSAPASPSLATPSIVSFDSFGGLGISVSASTSTAPVSSSDKSVSVLQGHVPSSSSLESLPTAAPVVRRPTREDKAPAPGPREDTVRKLRSQLKNINADTLDCVVSEILAVTKDQSGALAEVVSLIIDAAIDEPFSSDLYALLCQQIMEQSGSGQAARSGGKDVSSDEGQHHPFCVQILKQCRERLGEEGPQEGHVTPDDKDIVTVPTVPYSGDDAAPYSDRDTDCAAERGVLNLTKFISELLKVEVVTERIMHDAIKRLLPDLGFPSDEEIDCLCDVLTNVGYMLDTPDASADMDNYFARMAGLARSPRVNLRMQVMLQVSGACSIHVNILFFTYHEEYRTSLTRTAVVGSPRKNLSTNPVPPSRKASKRE